MINKQLHRGQTQGGMFECAVDLTCDELGAFIRVNTWNDTADSIPRSVPLNVAQARAVGQALLDAADAADALMPGRCECGDPVMEPGSLCLTCNVSRAKTRRATLRVVPQATR